MGYALELRCLQLGWKRGSSAGFLFEAGFPVVMNVPAAELVQAALRTWKPTIILQNS
jgi:hypothetical protein